MALTDLCTYVHVHVLYYMYMYNTCIIHVHVCTCILVILWLDQTKLHMYVRAGHLVWTEPRSCTWLKRTHSHSSYPGTYSSGTKLFQVIVLSLHKFTTLQEQLPGLFQISLHASGDGSNIGIETWWPSRLVLESVR